MVAELVRLKTCVHLHQLDFDSFKKLATYNKHPTSKLRTEIDSLISADFA